MTAYKSFLAAIVVGVVSAGPVLAQPVATPAPVRPADPVRPAEPVRLAEPMRPIEPMRLALEALSDSMLTVPLDALTVAHEATLLAGALHSLDFHYADSAQDRSRSAAEREKERELDARRSAQDREARLYDAGMRHVYDNRWEPALASFEQLVALKGSRVDAALYWKAYAQDRLGQRAEALTTIGTLTREHQTSRYLQQARLLEAEVRRNAGQPVRPQDQADEDLKLMAIASLQNSAPEQAVPMLNKLLEGNASPKLKERALFVLAQSNSPQAREVLKNIAKGGSTPELQNR